MAATPGLQAHMLSQAWKLAVSAAAAAAAGVHQVPRRVISADMHQLHSLRVLLLGVQLSFPLLLLGLPLGLHSTKHFNYMLSSDEETSQAGVPS